MSSSVIPTIIIVPGLRDHVPQHWQTLLEADLSNALSVPPLENDRLNCAAQVASLQSVINKFAGPIILVAHSAGVHTVAHWAQKHTTPILGAVLATPPDFELPLPAGYPRPDELAHHGWTPVPRRPLPFPTIVAASENDPLATLASVRDMARNWGSKMVELGEVGHLNPASGFGPWPLAKTLIRELM